jgi:hypothetical protein
MKNIQERVFISKNDQGVGAGINLGTKIAKM